MLRNVYEYFLCKFFEMIVELINEYFISFKLNGKKN